MFTDVCLSPVRSRVGDAKIVFTFFFCKGCLSLLSLSSSTQPRQGKETLPPLVPWSARSALLLSRLEDRTVPPLHPLLLPHASVYLTACSRPRLLAAHRNSQRLSETRDVISKVCIQPLSRGTPRPCDTTCRKILADGNPHRFGNYAKRSSPIKRRLPSRHLQVGADLVFEVGQALPSMAVAVKLHDSAKAPRQMK